jgi:hypothetical protein
MTAREDAVAALAAGRAAEPYAENPYAGTPVLARLWMAGYTEMLRNRFYSRPSIQPYLQARAQRN